MLDLIAAYLPVGAVLYTNLHYRLSVCVAYKAGSTQWRLLFTALNLIQRGKLTAGALRPEQFGPDELLAGQTQGLPPGTQSFVWQAFYNRSIEESWRHVHFIREPLERTVSAYLDLCTLHLHPAIHSDYTPCNHPAFRYRGATERNWTGSKDDVREFVLRLRHAREWFADQGLEPFHGEVDDHFRSQILGCGSYGVAHRRSGRPWFFNGSVAWADSSGLSHPARAICLERNVSAQLSAIAFPVTSHTMHATGAAALLQQLFSPDELLDLRTAIHTAYPKDHLLYERYRKMGEKELWMMGVTQ
mmetsp:Transcript_45353/g.119038  ORF Transcript_45353/g.119038 Transcript_45353/m.119038 type:complete len:302 (+) Transcript_45353:32-937(+)